jgi:hypothetical protein
MPVKDVQIEYDVSCEWHNSPPSYRLYVNNELFTERTYIWQDQSLEEVIPISAPPGDYVIEYQLIGQGNLVVRNPRVNHGSAEFISHNTLRIHNAI